VTAKELTNKSIWKNSILKLKNNYQKPYEFLFPDDMTAYSDNGDPQYPNGWMSQRTADSFHVEKRTGPAFTQETLGQVGPLQLSSGNSIRFMCETQNTPGYPTSKVNWLKVSKNEKAYYYCV